MVAIDCVDAHGIALKFQFVVTGRYIVYHHHSIVTGAGAHLGIEILCLCPCGTVVGRIIHHKLGIAAVSLSLDGHGFSRSHSDGGCHHFRVLAAGRRGVAACGLTMVDVPTGVFPSCRQAVVVECHIYCILVHHIAFHIESHSLLAGGLYCNNAGLQTFSSCRHGDSDLGLLAYAESLGDTADTDFGIARRHTDAFEFSPAGVLDGECGGGILCNHTKVMVAALDHHFGHLRQFETIDVGDVSISAIE